MLEIRHRGPAEGKQARGCSSTCPGLKHPESRDKQTMWIYLDANHCNGIVTGGRCCTCSFQRSGRAVVVVATYRFPKTIPGVSSWATVFQFNNLRISLVYAYSYSSSFRLHLPIGIPSPMEVKHHFKKRSWIELGPEGCEIASLVAISGQLPGNQGR